MARKTKIKPLEFQDALYDILSEYGEEITDKSPEAVQKVAEDCKQAVSQNISTAGIGGTKYRNSIQLTITKGRYIASATIHSPKHYQLTHLLEHGHAIKVRGKVYGKTRAFPHWAPAEQTANKALEDAIKKVVQS